MSRKKTTAEFITESALLHNHFYDYSETVYTTALDKITIICPTHGKFSQKPNSHLQGCGCPKCGVQKAHRKTTGTTTDFIEAAKKAHKNYYDYSRTEYTTSGAKVTIICPQHGSFTQLPSSHLAGKGCWTCGKAKCTASQTQTTSEFVKRATQIHNNRYSYSKSVYTKGKNNIDIECQVHGIFSQIAHSHLAGQGCPKCALENTGWSYTKWEQQGKSSNYFDSFKLYLVECWSNDERFLKIGKTFSTVGRRFQDKQTMPYQWRLIKQLDGDSRYISELEHRLHKECKAYSYTPSKTFGGSSECFSLEIMPLMQECYPDIFK